jgi:hypothetical protein
MWINESIASSISYKDILLEEIKIRMIFNPLISFFFFLWLELILLNIFNSSFFLFLFLFFWVYASARTKEISTARQVKSTWYSCYYAAPLYVLYWRIPTVASSFAQIPVISQLLTIFLWFSIQITWPGFIPIRARAVCCAHRAANAFACSMTVWEAVRVTRGVLSSSSAHQLRWGRRVRRLYTRVDMWAFGFQQSEFQDAGHAGNRNHLYHKWLRS